MSGRVRADCCAGFVRGEAELESGFLVTDVGEGFLEAFTTFLVAGGGVVEEGEQSLFHETEAWEELFVGEGDWTGRCFV